jgi:hypothetical protein
MGHGVRAWGMGLGVGALILDEDRGFWAMIRIMLCLIPFRGVLFFP